MTVTDGIGTTTYSYDLLGRLVSAGGLWANDTVSYTYDTAGRRHSLTVNGADEVDYGYDSLARLSGVTSPAGAFSYGYIGSSGLAHQMTRPNGAGTFYTYDALERLTSVQNLTGAGANLSTYNYG